MPRYFHLYADNKTVKEINRNTYRRYGLANWANVNKKKLCILFDSEIFFVREHGITIPLKQLNKILKKEAS